MMKRLIVALCLIAGFSLGARAAWHSVLQVSVGAAAPTPDGTAKTPSGNYSHPNTMSLTTTKTNDIIVVVVSANGTAGGNTFSVSDVAGLTWTFLSSNTGTNASSQFAAFWALSTGILSSDVITVNNNGASITYLEAIAFAVNGANTGSPFDANGSLPSFAGSGALSISTSHAADLIFAAFRGNTPVSADTGFTVAINGDFLGVEYKAVTTTQSGLAPTGNNTNNGGVGHAIVSP